MKLHINGKESIFSGEPVDGSHTLAALVKSLGMKPDRVAIELNRNIISRDRWPETMLSDGDRLEIVQFVGGGSCLSISVSPGCPSVVKILLFSPPKPDSDQEHS